MQSTKKHKTRLRDSRKGQKTAYKVDKNCLEGRGYEDFKEYIKRYPDKAIVEMDTVEGVKGESCLLTIHYPVSSFMLAIKREDNDSKSVIDFFDAIYRQLGVKVY